MRLSALLIVLALLVSACNDASDECPKNPDDASAYVIIGFWTNADCSGDPVQTNAFPVVSDAPCYCWPGHSGENSADTFRCDAEAGSFTYTQYGSLDCGAGDNTPTVKTSYLERCEQDIPPTLYSKVIDLGACGP